MLTANRDYPNAKLDANHSHLRLESSLKASRRLDLIARADLSQRGRERVTGGQYQRPDRGAALAQAWSA
jgi:hypothetical protein